MGQAMLVYRYDNQDYGDGEVIVSRGDHADGLTAIEREVEVGLRSASAEAASIRRDSLYTWKDEDFARLAGGYKRSRFLYELDVQDADIRHVGDLDHYSAAKDAAKLGQPYARHLEAYWTQRTGARRVEILVASACVVRKLSF